MGKKTLFLSLDCENNPRFFDLILPVATELGKNVLKNIFQSFYALYEPAEDDEENTTNVTVTEDMTKEEVLDKIKEVIE